MYSLQDTIKDTLRKMEDSKTDTKRKVEDLITKAIRLVVEFNSLPRLLFFLFTINTTTRFSLKNQKNHAKL